MWHLRWYVRRTTRDRSPSSGVDEAMRKPGRLWRVLQLAAAMAVAAWTITSARAAHAVGGCAELIRDGGFETGAAWELGASPLPPRYVSDTKHSGTKSLALGITDGGNVQSYSSARQMVTIPADARQVTISFWASAMTNGDASTDYMELALLTPDGAVLDKLWYSHDDSRTWNQMAFDISLWRGRTVLVYFNVYNDGLGGTAGMFLDDVSLLVCADGATGTLPAPTPTSACPSSASPACLGPTPPPAQAQCALWLPCRTPTGPSATPAPTPGTAAAGASPIPAPTPTICSAAALACSLAAAIPSQPSGAPAVANLALFPFATAAGASTPMPGSDSVTPASGAPAIAGPSLTPVATAAGASTPMLGSDSMTPVSGDPAAAAPLTTSSGSGQVQWLSVTSEVTRLALPMTATAPPTVTPTRTQTPAAHSASAQQPPPTTSIIEQWIEQWPAAPGVVGLIVGAALLTLGVLARKLLPKG